MALQDGRWRNKMPVAGGGSGGKYPVSSRPRPSCDELLGFVVILVCSFGDLRRRRGNDAT